MQGLVSYAGDSESDSERDVAGPSSGAPSKVDAEHYRDSIVTAPRPTRIPAPTSVASPAAHDLTSTPIPAAPISSASNTRKHISGIKLSKPSSSSSVASGPSARSERTKRDRERAGRAHGQGKGKGKERLEGRERSASALAGVLEEDLGYGQRKPGIWELYDPSFEGLAESEVFRRVTLPSGITGKTDWGIPEVTGVKCTPMLEAKVQNFLELKRERDQHINTTLLSSTAFANPHIYTKLVEFVDIDERGSGFPGGGWLTRTRLEERKASWGPALIAERQKAAQDASKLAQTPGSRSSIQFQTSSAPNGKRGPSTGGDPYPFLLPMGIPAGVPDSAAGENSGKSNRDRQHELREKLARRSDGRDGERKSAKWDR